jgi:hypothetical protein
MQTAIIALIAFLIVILFVPGRSGIGAKLPGLVGPDRCALLISKRQAR